MKVNFLIALAALAHGKLLALDYSSFTLPTGADSNVEIESPKRWQDEIGDLFKYTTSSGKQRVKQR